MNKNYLRQLWIDVRKDRWLYLFLLPAAVLIIIFCYLPMYGITIAFKDFNGLSSIMESDWAGFRYFSQILKDPLIPRAFSNTLILGLLTIIFCFPAPILLSLCFNELKVGPFKKISQTASYLPYFISTVIVVGMLKEFLAIDGLVNTMLRSFHIPAVNFMSDAGAFRSIYIISELWQGIGWGSILYLAAISSIADEMYEAAVIDGASRIQRILYITLPSMLPTICIQFILAIGNLLGASFEKVVLMYSAATYETADILATYIYRNGLQSANYSYGVAVGTLNALISFTLVFCANRAMKRFFGHSFW